jgi:NUMOD4 motif/HNH endonuclease
MQEIWKSLENVVDYGNNYEVSNLGNVRHITKGNTLKGRISPKGYLKVVLYYDGSNKNYQLHRLVALTFIPNPENKPQVNHKDGIKSNNKVDNLEWSTNGENQRHAFENGLQNSRKGVDNNSAKLTEEDVIKIKKMIIDNVSQTNIAKLFNISKSNVRSIQNGSIWSHIHVDGFMPHKKDANGENNINSKITKDEARSIRELWNTGDYSHRELGKMFGISKTSIANIVNHKTWKYI